MPVPKIYFTLIEKAAKVFLLAIVHQFFFLIFQDKSFQQVGNYLEGVHLEYQDWEQQHFQLQLLEIAVNDIYEASQSIIGELYVW